jgi:hypothetical protein
MYCLKCGKGTQEEHVFCDSCLEVMDRYPIKPGTPVQLPHRDSSTAPKKTSRRRTYSQDELILQLRVTVRVLAVCLLATLLLLGYFIWRDLQPKKIEAPSKEIGQNYTVDITADRGE